MENKLPTITVLIAARPGQADIKALDACRRLNYPTHLIETIVARGKQPSAQRNTGLKAARGEWIYFLDDDSVPPPDNLLLIQEYFAEQSVQMLGGPNLCPPNAPGLEQVFALVLSSWLAFGPSRARYAQIGGPRSTSEKELILCNLLARREALLKLGGFNEALYPNEENALMDELQKQGGRLVYHPQFYVHRRPRSNLSSFCRMLMTYGRGRAEQFRLHPTPGSILNFIPPLFCVYLLALLSASVLAPGILKILVLPLLLYLALVLAQSLMLLRRQPGGSGGSGHNPPAPVRIFRAMWTVPLIILTHVLYGAGFWRGLATPLKRPGERAPVKVDLENPNPLRVE